MSLNWKEIDMILSELNIEGSHIQKIRQPDFKTLVLDLYKPGERFSLLTALNQGRVRFHRLGRKIENKVPLQRFAQLLRSRIKGGKITEIRQIGEERIVILKILRGDETTTLFLRLWGGNPNIIAADSNGVILDAFFRRPAKGETSGKIYSIENELGSPGKRNTANRNFEVRPFPKTNDNFCFNTFIENFYFNLESNLELKELSDRAKRILMSKETQLVSAMEALKERISRGSTFNRYKEQAELLKSNLYRIKPKTEEVTVDNYFNNNEQIVIKLDKNLSPSQNVERLFKKYKKEKSGLENLQLELTNVKIQLEKLKNDTEKLFAEGAEPQTKIINFRDFLSSIPKQTITGKKEKTPGLKFDSQGFTILLGRTSAENDTLLRRHVKGNDSWLHTRDFPGGYVFIKHKKGKSIPLDTLLDAGNLALFFSKGRKNAQGELYYTQVKYLRRAKDGKKGLVLPTHEKNLSIRLDNVRLNRLLNRENIYEN